MYSGGQSAQKVRIQTGTRQYEDVHPSGSGSGGHVEMGEGLDDGSSHAELEVWVHGLWYE